MPLTPIYQLKTFSDLYTAVREELKIQSTDTTAIQRIQRDLNIVYLEEVVPFTSWKWLRGNIDLPLFAAISAGTASARQGSTSVTLTVPIASSKKGWLFGVIGYSEVYRIAEHASNTGTIILEAPYTGATQSLTGYKIWTDEIYLPSFVRETFEVTHDFNDQPLENCGLQQFRQYVAALPRAEGRPYFYTTNHYYDPMAYALPAGMPTISSRSSDTINKTLTFASDVSNFINQGDRISVSGAGDPSYNGQFVIASQSGATITYTGVVPIYEGTTVDTTLVLQKLQPSSDTRRAKRFLVYPAIFNQNTTLHVDFIKEVPPLQNDTDEPLMPIGDRTVLLYGGLHRAWSRERNPDEAKRNFELFDRKLAKMAGKLDDSIDQPKLVPNKIYLGAKRMVQRERDQRNGLPEGWGGGASGGQVISGTANTVAIFNSSGALGSSTVSNTQLSFLNTVNSTLSGNSDVATLSNKTLLDSTTAIANVTDQTKKFMWSLGGQNAATTTTLSTLSTANRIIIVPDISDTLVTKTTTDTLTNKSLDDATDLFINTATPTKKLGFSLTGQTAATTLTLASIVSTNRTLTFPDATDTLVCKATTDVLTNKTIASSANTITGISDVNINSTGLTNSSINTSAAIARTKLAASSANWAAVYDTNGFLTGVAPGAVNNVLTSNGTLWQSSAPASAPADPRNSLLNSAFDYWQRTLQANIATGASTYAADRWYGKNSMGGGTVQFSRVSSTLNGSLFAAQLKISSSASATTNGCELYQVLENRDSIMFYASSASSQIQVKGLGNVNQMGLQFFSSTSENKLATAIGSEQTVSVTSTGFTFLSVSGQAIGSGHTTAGCIGVRVRPTAVSSGNLYDVNNGFVCEQAGINVGTSVGTWGRAHRNAAKEFSACQRFYEKSYDLASTAGTVTTTGCVAYDTPVASATIYTQVPYSVRKRSTSGALTVYSTQTGAPNNVYNLSGSADITFNAVTAGEQNYNQIVLNSTLTLGQVALWQWTVDAEI